MVATLVLSFQEGNEKACETAKFLFFVGGSAGTPWVWLPSADSFQGCNASEIGWQSSLLQAVRIVTNKLEKIQR